MPELPDLEVFSHNLDKKLSGKHLKEIKLPSNGKSKTTTAGARVLAGQILKKVRRSGKELFFDFDKGDVLSMHLMLNGELHLVNGHETKKYTSAELIFDDDVRLVMTDFRGMAHVTLNPPESGAPDALAKEVDQQWWQNTLKKRSAIKNVLLDQKIIRGIGNAYADEILWHARISPFSVCNKIPADKVKELAHAVKAVLADAEKQIRKSKPDIISGEVRDFLKIHHTKKDKSPTGSVIHVKAGGRKTYYTDEQEIYK